MALSYLFIIYGVIGLFVDVCFFLNSSTLSGLRWRWLT